MRDDALLTPKLGIKETRYHKRDNQDEYAAAYKNNI
jgi:hypothetical protein